MEIYLSACAMPVYYAFMSTFINGMTMKRMAGLIQTCHALMQMEKRINRGSLNAVNGLVQVAYTIISNSLA